MTIADKLRSLADQVDDTGVTEAVAESLWSLATTTWPGGQDLAEPHLAKLRDIAARRQSYASRIDRYNQEIRQIRETLNDLVVEQREVTDERTRIICHLSTMPDGPTSTAIAAAAGVSRPRIAKIMSFQRNHPEGCPCHQQPAPGEER